MTLSLLTGTGPIALLQKGSIARTLTPGGGGPVTLSLPAPSTAGTALLAILTAQNGATISAAPPGWVQVISANPGTDVTVELWAYYNNPGNITSPVFTGGFTTWITHLSEWSNVAIASVLETSGSVTAGSGVGSTLVPTTSSGSFSTGDLAFVAWAIHATLGGVITFTTPSGFTRLIDDGSDTTSADHIDVEYWLNPRTGGPLGPSLTSSSPLNAAAAVIVVLKGSAATLDQTPYLAYGSLSVKLNTFDFGLIQGGRLALEDGSGFYQLEDGSGDYLLDTYVPQLGDAVALTNPAWNGRVVSVTRTDLTNLQTNYRDIAVTATNTTAAPGGIAPGDLSDVPAGGYLQLEDGSGDYQLEDGSGNVLLEGTSFAYRHLSVKTSQNQDGTTTTYGSLETFETGFAAGQTFLLTSQNLGYAAQQFTITNVTVQFLHTTPVYLIEFGDAYSTLQTAGGGVLTRQATNASIIQGQVAPGGTYGFVELSATQGTFTALTDLSGLTLTVTPPSGRRYRIETVVPLSSSVALDILAITIAEGATVLAGAQDTNPSSGGYVDLAASKVIVADGATHTYKVQAERASGTGNVTMQAGQTQVGVTHYAHLLIEDIGT